MLKKATNAAGVLGFCALLTGWAAGSASANVSHMLRDQTQSVVGELRHRVLVHEDTFAKIARDEGVGYEALRRANPGVDEWLPGEGTSIVLPTRMILPDAARRGIVVNLSELRLYFYDPSAGSVSIYPIGIGYEGTETPLMTTQVVAKLENPTWYPPESVRLRHAANGKILPRQVPPGKENPLGTFAIKLGRDGYFIHGTNRPIGVGQRVSAGCIRLYEPHIRELVGEVVGGTPVVVIRQPFKVAWDLGELYMEAHPRLGEDARSHSGFVAEVIRATQNHPIDVDWDLAFATARQAMGLPVKISR